MRYLSFAGLVVFFLASASAAIECQVSNSISGQQVSNLPLNGRDFQNLATITPGEATSRLHDAAQHARGPR